MSFPDPYQYIPYDERDRTYFGCRKVIEAEWGYIRKRRKNPDPDQAVAVLPEEEEQVATTAVPEQDGRGRWWMRFTEVFTHIVRRQIPGSPPRPDSETEAELGPPPNLTGIALSGGGIRSASFCLGVLQALAYAGWLKKLDYMSTVSGGGYIGGALTWLLHKKWIGPEGKEIVFGLDRHTFPFGSYPMVGMEDPRLIDDGRDRNSYKGRLLRHLRQNANYLRPGNGINLMSLLAVALRNTLFSLFVYGGVLVLLFLFLGPILYGPIHAKLDWLPELDNLAQGLAVLIALMFVAAGAMYAVLTYVLPHEVSTGYNLRRFFLRWLGYLLTAFVVMLVIIVIPPLHRWIDQAGKSKLDAITMNLSGLDSREELVMSGQIKGDWAQFPPNGELTLRDTAGRGKLHVSIRKVASSGDAKQTLMGDLKPKGDSRPEPTGKSGQDGWKLSDFRKSTLVATLSTLLGSFASLWAFFQAGKEKPKVPTAVPVALGSFALIFGGLLLAYILARLLQPHLGMDSYALPVTGIVFLFFLAFPNLNYLSLHRYYRDRLMETFTPDLQDAVHVNGAVPGAPKSADRTNLHQMLVTTDESRQLGPYPIINANIVLVSSKIPKFRARCGDNFILTPKYCGSNATGWCETESEASPYKSMTVPTAIAISGAAVNSNTGSGGDGITRSPWLSFLMGFLNIRLGYWAPNPTPDKKRLERIAADLDREILTMPQREDRPAWAYEVELVWHGLKIMVLWPLKQLHMAVHRLLSVSWGSRPHEPKAVYPGLLELFMRTNLDQNSQLVQLSDGGHFENLGLYELVRRRLKLIIVCDGTADSGFGFDDLANAMEKVRSDFGALIKLDARDLENVTLGCERGIASRPGDEIAFAERGYLIAKIIYNDRTEGTLLYLNTTLFKAVTADIYGYRKAHEEFPDEPTRDQFFDEKQFEAYRELGYQTAHRMMCDPTVAEDVASTLGTPQIGCGER